MIPSKQFLGPRMVDLRSDFRVIGSQRSFRKARVSCTMGIASKMSHFAVIRTKALARQQVQCATQYRIFTTQSYIALKVSGGRSFAR